MLDLCQGQLSGEHHPGKAQVGRLFDPLQVMDGHLGGGVDGEIGGRGPDHPGHPQVLDDEGVGPQLAEAEHRLPGPGQLPVGEEGVEGDIGFDPPQAAEAHGLLQVLPLQIFGVAPGVEVPGAEIHGIGPAPDSGDDPLQGPRRTHQLHHSPFLLSRLRRATSARSLAHSSA